MRGIKLITQVSARKLHLHADAFILCSFYQFYFVTILLVLILAQLVYQMEKWANVETDPKQDRMTGQDVNETEVD